MIFAIGRMPGWIANYKEIMEEPKSRIYRPRQIYIGRTLNHYVPLDEREIIHRVFCNVSSIRDERYGFCLYFRVLPMKKILVIDDEEWLREMIQLALRQRGYDVIEASNGQDGIEKARKELPDLILCDVNMDKVDGYLTLASLRNEAPTAAIPFILMTGLANNDGMRHGMELGADDYLPKPFTTEALYAAVDARLKKAQTRPRRSRTQTHPVCATTSA